MKVLGKDGQVVLYNGRRFSFSTVALYCSRYHDNPETIRERLDRAVKQGHNLIWLNEEPVVISDPPTVKPPVEIELIPGEMVLVDSPYQEERGYWIVDNYRDGSGMFRRPVAVFEVWSEQQSVIVVPPWGATSLAMSLIDNGHRDIHIVRHAPNEYARNYS